MNIESSGSKRIPVALACWLAVGVFLSSCSMVPPAPVVGIPITAKLLPKATKDLAPKAPTVSLAWDTSPDPAVTGYHLYYGAASRTYTNTVDVGNTNWVTVPLYLARTYFAATCYTTNGLESAYSMEVVYDTSRVFTIGAEWAPSPLGPWAPVPGFTPLTVTNPAGNAFFRLSIQ